MKKLQWLTILMGVTLVIIIAFQVYWLNDNYDREKRTVDIKTAVAFQETVQQLQAEKLKLPNVFLRASGSGKSQNIFIEEKNTGANSKLPVTSKSKRISYTNVIRTKGNENIINDSTKKKTFMIFHQDSNQLTKRSFPVRIRTYDSSLKNKEIFVEEGFRSDNKMDVKSRRQIITMVNTLRTKINDSTKVDSLMKPNFVIKVHRDSSLKRTIPITIKKYIDSGRKRIRIMNDTNNHALRVLYSVDSLQDSLKLPEITKAYAAALKRQNLNIPFSIIKIKAPNPEDDEDMSNVTVGFMNPITYHLSLGSTFPFLIKKLTLPILFSIFLIGVTILSFVVLYNNLLKQQRLGDIKNEFISNITHELKTPISTVSVAIEAMKNFNALQNPQRTAEYLDIAENELQRLTMLVDKVLKLSMFEQQQIELKYEKFDIGKLTAEVIKSMRLQFEKFKAQVTLDSKGNDFYLIADRLHITSVLYNLIDNALKYSGNNPEIKIVIEGKETEIQLTVSDKGKGIPNEYKAKVFEKFFRVPHGDAHNIKGYGLGLSYVSHIIAQHKGTIQVESELNKGSSFIIKLPRTYG